MEVIKDQSLVVKIIPKGLFISMVYGFKKLAMIDTLKTVYEVAKVLQKLITVQGQGCVTV